MQRGEDGRKRKRGREGKERERGDMLDWIIGGCKKKANGECLG